MSSSIPHASGVYEIRCIPTGKVYIGSAADLAMRWRKHRARLVAGKHENPYLQHAWDKHGADAFEFRVIELVLSTFRLEREQYWLDKLKAYDRAQGFNISLTAGAPMDGRKHSAESLTKMSKSQTGRKHSEATKRMMSERNKGKVFGKQTEETLRKKAENARGRKHSEETRAKMSAAQLRNASVTRSYIVTLPSGEEVPIVNLARFCREHGLSSGCMLRIARGYNKQHKGYACRYPDGVIVPPPKPRPKAVHPEGWRRKPISAAARAARSARMGKSFVLTDPDGVEHHIVNLTRFCREHGLDVSTIYRVMRGKRADHKGWTCRSK